MHTSTINNEKELVAKVAQGNESAFTQLFYAYHNKLGAYILRVTGSPEMAEEIVQDVFMKIWLKRTTMVAIKNFGSYLYVLSRNQALNYLRQHAKELMRRQKAVENMVTLSEADLSTEREPDYYLFLDQAVNELPPQQQKVYILNKRERLKYEEIAHRMNISRETVKKYLKLATRSVTSYVRAHSDMLTIILLIILLCSD